MISLHSIHHDAEYYPQPEEFLPERFSQANGGTKKFKDMGIYMPFGDGPRICLGNPFLKDILTPCQKLFLNFFKYFCRRNSLIMQHLKNNVLQFSLE